MSIKVTMKQLLEVDLEGLGSLKNVPAKPSYAIGKLIRLARTELELFQEARFKLIKENGEEVDGYPNTYKVAPEKEAEVEALLKPLVAAEVELQLNPIKLEELGDRVEGNHLALTFSTVQWFISE